MFFMFNNGYLTKIELQKRRSEHLKALTVKLLKFCIYKD